MSAWLLPLFSLSLSGAVLIAVLYVVTRFMGNRLGRRWQYYIWLLAILRLLMPIATPVNLIGSLFVQQEQAISSYRTNEVWGESAETGNVISPSQEVQPPKEQEPEYDKPISAAQFAVVIWLMVAIGLFIKKIYHYNRVVWKLCTESISPDRFAEPFTHACETCGLRQKPMLYVSQAIPSPVAFGVLHPSIAVPSGFSDNYAYYAFLHELMHVRQFDTIYKWIVEFVVCIHWFNPMVYVLRHETARACELSCDEAVIQKLNHTSIRAYGDTLLATLRHSTTPFGATMTLPLSKNAKWMKERLAAIMEFKKKGKICACIALGLTLVLAGGAVLCGFAPAQWQGAETEPQGNGMETLKAPETSITYISDKIRWDSSEILRRPDKKFYQTSLFLQDGYIVGLAWNVDSSKYETVRQIREKSVCFTKKTIRYADDPVITEVVGNIMDKQIKVNKSFSPEELVLLGVDGPFSSTPDELAERFYAQNNVGYFSAAIMRASADTCEKMIQQAYTDNRIEYFAVALGEIQRISNGKIQEIAKKAVQDRKIEFFAVASEYLSNNELASYAREAYESGNVEIFAVTIDSMSEDEIKSLAQRAVQDGKTEFFAVAADALTDAELAQIAQNAYSANRIEIFYLACDALTSQQAAEFADKAYHDNRIEFFYAVMDQLTDTQREALRERASRDRKIEFWYVLND